MFHDILNHCGARFAVVSNRAQVDKIAAMLARRSGLRTIAVMDPDGPWPEGVTTLADVAACGHRRLVSDMAAAHAFEERAMTIERDALATIIHTSGTTGEPKGVMLTEDSR